MRILTVRQPWAWAIIHGGKDVENRVRNIAGSYRGPVAIHVGLTYDSDWRSKVLDDAMRPGRNTRGRIVDLLWRRNVGTIIGVVDLTDVHHSANCMNPVDPVDSSTWKGCTPWAEPVNVHHLVLANPRPLATPIPYKGALGLRKLPDDAIGQIAAEVAS